MRRLVVGISGSSAPQLGIRLLEVLGAQREIETHVVVSAGARRTIPLESDRTVEEVEALADVVHDGADLTAPISSGSFLVDSMVVMPCSMRSLAAIATGNTTDLLTRAADVTLKERRPLVLVTRETPLNLIHLRNMETVTLAGGTILPPTPAFYHRPQSVADMLDQIVGKVLDHLHMPHELFTRWGSGA